MADLATRARPVVLKLVAKDDDQLFGTLGDRLNSLASDPSKGGELEPEEDIYETLGFRADVQEFGKNYFARVNKECFNLVCGAEGDNTEERAQVSESVRTWKTGRCCRTNGAIGCTTWLSARSCP
jgi:hypothetical protein